jgi:hypothetical protein
MRIEKTAAVELSVNGILAAVDDFLTVSGTQAYRTAAGLDPVSRRHSELFEAVADVTRPETTSFLRELVTSARIDATKKSRVERLLSLVVELSARRAMAPAKSQLDDLLLQKSLVAAGRTWTVDEAIQDAWALSTTEARAQLSAERSAGLWSAFSLFAGQVDALAETAQTRGFSSPTALVETVRGRSFATGISHGESALDHSRDAAFDVLAYALKRVDPHLKPDTARQPDLERALAAPWFFELLRKEDLWHVVTRVWSDLGFHPSAHGRILIDTDHRPGRTRFSTLAPVEVPDQIRLVLTAAPGFDGYAHWLGAWGEALFWAEVPKSLPFIDRVVGDAVVPLAIRKLFELLPTDELWLRRAAKLTSAQSREVARLFALRQLMELRREAALLPVTSDILSRGAVRSLADGYISSLERAVFVAPERGRLIIDIDVLAKGLVTLDAFALETHLMRTLRERFNEDWWRNPAAGRFLVALSSRGVAEDIKTVATSFGAPEALDVTDAARRLVLVMGA